MKPALRKIYAWHILPGYGPIKGEYNHHIYKASSGKPTPFVFA
jgi:hypothetical protein